MVAFKSAGTTFATATNTSTTTFTANVPTGGGAPASGDLLIAIGVDWAGTGTKWNGDTGGAALPTGWTQVRADNDGATGDIGVHVYQKVAGASEANQNFTLSVAEEGVMVMLCYSSPDSTTPVDASQATITDPATASVTLTTPVVTTNVANDILILIYGFGSDNNGSTTAPVIPTPSTTTNRVATFGTRDATNTWTMLSVDDVSQVAAGNSAQFSSATTGSGASTHGAAAVVVALKGAAAAAAQTPYQPWYQRAPVLAQ